MRCKYLSLLYTNNEVCHQKNITAFNTMSVKLISAITGKRWQPNHTAEIPTVKEHRLLNKNDMMWERDVLSRKVTCLRARASFEVMQLCLKLYYTEINMWQDLRIPHIGLTFILGWPMLHHECRTVKWGHRFFQPFICLPHLNQAKPTFLLVLLEIITFRSIHNLSQ